MDIIISNELKEAIHKVGELIKNDHRYIEMTKASADYSSNAELNSMLDEYGALQASLAAEYEKEDLDEASIKPIQERMNELYSSVTSHPVYVAFKESSESYSELTDAVYAELEYAVTGQRKVDCTHDCSTCHGCD